MDTSTILSLLRRTDDEAAVYHFQILEQLCEVLVRAQDMSIVEQYPPQDFLPALCNIFKCPVHIFPETPVLCCRAIKCFLNIDQSRGCLRAVMTQNVTPAYLKGLDITDTQTSRDLGEECIKTLEMFSQGSPAVLHKAQALLPVLRFKDMCQGKYPSDVKLSAMNIIASICTCVNPFMEGAEMLALLRSLVHELDVTKTNDGKGANSIRESVLSSLSILCDRGCFSIPSTDTVFFAAIKDQLLPQVIPMLSSTEDARLQNKVAVMLSKLLAASEHMLGSMMELGVLSTLSRVLDTSDSEGADGGSSTTVEILALCETLLNLLFVGHRLSALRSSPLQLLLRRNSGLQVGDAVFGMHPVENKWMLGHIVIDNGDGTFGVNYDDGQFVPRSNRLRHATQGAETSTETRLLRAIQENNLKLVNDCLSRKGRPIELLKVVDGQGTPTIVWALAVGNTDVVMRLVKHVKQMTPKAAKDRLMGIALRTAAAFGRPWAVQHLIDEGANLNGCSGTGVSAIDSARIGAFWAQVCNATVKRGGKHDDVFDLLQGLSKKTTAKQDEHDLRDLGFGRKANGDDITMATADVEMKNAHADDGGAPLLSSLEDSLQEKDEKKKKKPQALLPKPPSQLDTLSFLETYIKRYQVDYVNTVLKALCHICQNPSCDSTVRKHAVRLILSVVQFTTPIMLHTVSSARLAPATPGPDGVSGNRARAGSVSHSSVASVLMSLVEQLLSPVGTQSAAAIDYEMFTLALRLTWSLLSKDGIHFYSELIRRGIVEKVEKITHEGSGVPSEVRASAEAILEWEHEENSEAEDGARDNPDDSFTPSPVRNAAQSPSSPGSPGRGKTKAFRNGSPGLQTLMRAGSTFDRLSHIVAALEPLRERGNVTRTIAPSPGEIEEHLSNLVSIFSEGDLTAYEFEQSRVESVLNFFVRDGGIYTQMFLKALGQETKFSEDGPNLSSNAAFQNIVSSLQTTLAMATDVTSNASPGRSQIDNKPGKSPDPFTRSVRVCFKRHPAETDVIGDLNGKVFNVEPLVTAFDLQKVLVDKVTINIPEYKRWALWLVAKRVEVFRENGMWAVGEVESFDRTKGVHKVVYNDGDTRSHVMANLKYRVVPFDKYDEGNSLRVEPHIISATRDGNFDEVLECLGNDLPLDKDMYDIDIVNSFGNTALHIAASWERIDIMRLLISRGASLNAVNSAGGTPLHWAARYGKIESIHVLATAGADMNILDNDRNTPADIAETADVAEVVFSRGGHITEAFFSVGDKVYIRPEVWDTKSFPLNEWPSNLDDETIANLKASSLDPGDERGIGKIRTIITASKDGTKQGTLVVDFPVASVTGWSASPMEVRSIDSPYYILGQQTLADAATWKSSLSVLGIAAEQDGYVESITMVLARPPSQKTFNVQVYERVESKQFRLISNTPISVNVALLTPHEQTIKIELSEQPWITRGQYLGISCAKSGTLSIHSRSTHGHKMTIYYGDPPTREGQIATLKSYQGTDKRGATMAGWFAKINSIKSLEQPEKPFSMEDQMLAEMDEDGMDLSWEESPMMNSFDNSTSKSVSSGRNWGAWLAPGTRVMAMWKEGRRPKYNGWYLATVTAANQDGTFALQYDDGYKDHHVRDQYIRRARDSEKAAGVQGNGPPADAHKPRKKGSHTVPKFGGGTHKPSDGSKPNMKTMSLSSANRSSRSESTQLLAAMKDRVNAMKQRLEASGLALKRTQQSPSGSTAASPFSFGVPMPPSAPMAPPPRPPSPPAASVAQLVDMGFPEDVVKRALVAAHMDPNRAVEYCMDPDSLPTVSIPSSTSSLPPGMLPVRGPRLPKRIPAPPWGTQGYEANTFPSTSPSLHDDLGRMFGGLMDLGLNSEDEDQSDDTSGFDRNNPPQPSEDFMESLCVGMMVDAKDSYEKWYEASIVDMRTNEHGGKNVHVHFFGWSDKFNEWIDLSSGRVQPTYTVIEPWREDLCVEGAMVEYRTLRGEEGSAEDQQSNREWHIVKVVEVDENEQRIKVTSLMQSGTAHPDKALKGEAWVSIDSERLCKQGTHIMAVPMSSEKLLGDPRALAHLLQNPESLKGALAAMASDPSGRTSQLQKHLNFLAKRIDRRHGENSGEGVEDASPLYWQCFKCTFEKNLPFEERCRLCGNKCMTKPPELVANVPVVVRNDSTGVWMEGKVAKLEANGSVVVSFKSAEEQDMQVDSAKIKDTIQISKTALTLEKQSVMTKNVGHGRESSTPRLITDRHRSSDTVRLSGRGVLQDPRNEGMFVSRGGVGAFEQSKASELFVMLPGTPAKEMEIPPFEMELFIAEKHFYGDVFGSSALQGKHEIKLASTVTRVDHKYNPLALVGERVEFYWVLEEQWFKGTVHAFDARSSTHTIIYDDGEVKTYDLGKKTWRPMREAAQGDIVELWNHEDFLYMNCSVTAVNDAGISYELRSVKEEEPVFERVNAVSFRLLKEVCGHWKEGDIVNVSSEEDGMEVTGPFSVNAIIDDDGECNALLQLVPTADDSMSDNEKILVEVGVGDVRDVLVQANAGADPVLSPKCAHAVRELFNKLCQSFMPSSDNATNIPVDIFEMMKSVSSLCRWASFSPTESVSYDEFVCLALDAAKATPNVLWDDLTSIVRVRYDLMPRVKMDEEEVEEPASGLDQCGSKIVGPAACIVSAIEQWHTDTSQGELGPDHVYTFFYKLKSVPDKFVSTCAPRRTDNIIRNLEKPGFLSAKLPLLRRLRSISMPQSQINETLWVNKSLTRHFLMALNDCFRMASDSLPGKLNALIQGGYENGAFLLPFELRRYYFQATAFGVRRSLFFLQQEGKRALLSGTSPSPGAKSRDGNSGIQFRLSKLCRELVTISRSSILDHAQLFFEQHGFRSASLEVRFIGEKGTGSGVTREFFSALSSAFQDRKQAVCGAPISPDLHKILHFSPFVVSSGYGDSSPSGDLSCRVSGFPSYVARGVMLTEGKWYYEVEVTKVGLAQVGWASADFEGGDSDSGDGVGDDNESWAFDGSRVLKWHGGKKSSFGVAWQAGDIIGCSIDFDKREIAYSRNGSFDAPMGVAFKFQDTVAGMYPAISINGSFTGRVRVGGGGLMETKNDCPSGYSPVFNAFYRKAEPPREMKASPFHPMWVDDSRQDGNYVMNSDGLFPAPLPPSHPHTQAVFERFKCLGQFVGRALMDGQILSLPLSSQFLSLVIGNTLCFDQVLAIYNGSPTRGNMLSKLARLVEQGNPVDKAAFHDIAGEDLFMEDMVTGMPLVEGGAVIPVTIENVAEYVRLMGSFILQDGVARQVDAFRQGLDTISPVLVSKLSAFLPREIRNLICGDETIDWTEDDISECINAEHGYKRGSPQIRNLVSVLFEFDQAERKSFLNFLTGCPHLPNGGLKYLDPPICVMRKNPSDEVASVDEALSSSRTCRNQLHLPPYTSKEVMRKKLKQSMEESKGIIDLA